MPAPIKPQERKRRLLIGERVRRHRLLNGWTQDDLGDHLARGSGLHLRRQTIDKIEDGSHRLTSDVVSALESALRQPPGALTAQDGGLAVRTRAVGLSADTKVAPNLRRFAEQIILRAAQERITEATAAKRGRSFRSPFTFTASTPSQEEIEGQADLLREKWGLGDGPIADLTYSMERQSAIVVSVNSNRPCVVYSARVTSFPVILWHGRPPADLNESAEYRVRVLGALVVSLGLSRGLANDDAADRADKLSRAILLPKVAITDTFGTRRNQITAANLLALASQYVITIPSALARACEAGIIDEQRAETIRRALNGQLLDGTLECSRWKKLLLPAFR